MRVIGAASITLNCAPLLVCRIEARERSRLDFHGSWRQELTNSTTSSARAPVQNSSTGIICLSNMDLKRWITPDRAVRLGSMLALAAYCRDLRYDFILD